MVTGLQRTARLQMRKYADFQQVTRSRTVGMAFSASADIEALALSLLAPLFPVAKGIRLIGVTVSSLDG
ncbi:MAG: DNA polymerase IV, partial [Bosea sp. (in: a-proteobacteria)]|nr:DNA polymerase IV [Bosea sp. (in: a-proteobacteria)]